MDPTGGLERAVVDGDVTSIRFADAEVDIVQHRFVLNGVRIELDRSVFDLLVFLLLRAPETANKAELLVAGWPSRVVTENSLSKAIARLRNVLGDQDGSVVESVHGFGYRIALPVTLISDVARIERPQALPRLHEASDPEPLPPAQRQRWLPRRWVPAAVSVALAATAIGVILAFALPILGVAETMRATPPAAPSLPAARSTTVAILPFENGGADRTQDFLAEGIWQQIDSDLSRFPQLRLVHPGTLAQHGASMADIKAIATEFQVSTVVAGSIRVSTSRVQMSVQIRSAENAELLWEKDFDRPRAELFLLQDEIVRDILSALRIDPDPAPSSLMIRSRTTDSVEAYTEYLAGFKLFKDDESGGRRSLMAFERAVAIDPDFTDAWLRIADLLGHNGFYADDADEALQGKRRALDIVDRLIERDPEYIPALLMRGAYRYSHWWDWQGAMDDYQRAAALGADDDEVYLLNISRLHAAMGDLDEASEFAKRAFQSNPQSNGAGLAGYELLSLGRFDEARSLIQKNIDNVPHDEHAYYYMGLCDLLQGRLVEADAHFENSAHVLRLAGVAAAKYSAGDIDGSNRELQSLITRFGHLSAFGVAQVYAWRGEHDLAFEWLEKATTQHEASLMYLKFDPLLASLRSDPRYIDVMRRVRLDPGPLH